MLKRETVFLSLTAGAVEIIGSALFGDRFWSGSFCDPVSLSTTGFVPAGLLYLKRERLAQLLAVFHRKVI